MFTKNAVEKSENQNKAPDNYSISNQTHFAISMGIFLRSEDLIKIVLINQFVCDFVLFCQSIWIFSILTIYDIPSWEDTLIWVFPFFMASKIKPSLLVYVKMSKKSKISKIITSIIVSYVISISGIYLLVFSTQPQRVIDVADMTTEYSKLRVILFSIGWTLSKTAIEVIYDLSEETQAIIFKNPNTVWDHEELDKIKIISKITACLFCIISTLNVQTYRDFYYAMSKVFQLGSLLCFTAIIVLYSFNNFRSAPLKPNKPKQDNSTKDDTKTPKVASTFKRSVTKVIHINRVSQFMQEAQSFFKKMKNYYSGLKISDMFHGLVFVYRIPIQQKIYICVYWIRKVLIVSIKMYATSWITQCLSQPPSITNHKHGLIIGSFIICSFQVLNAITIKFITANKRFNYLNNENKTIYQTLFILISIALVFLYLYSWITKSVVLLTGTLILTSLLAANLQIFSDFDQQANNKLHSEYQQAQNTMFYFSHYFAYLFFPYFSNYLTKTKSKSDGLLIITVLLAVLVLIKVHYLKSFKNRSNKDSQITSNMLSLSMSNYMNVSTMFGKAMTISKRGPD